MQVHRGGGMPFQAYHYTRVRFNLRLAVVITEGHSIISEPQRRWKGKEAERLANETIA
jgi:hypothetical protein